MNKINYSKCIKKTVDYLVDETTNCPPNTNCLNDVYDIDCTTCWKKYIIELGRYVEDKNAEVKK